MENHNTCKETTIDTASKDGDADKADLLTEVSRGMDKLLWMVEAHTIEGMKPNTLCSWGR